MVDRFKTVKKGYDPADVENYILNLESIIKNYRDKEAAINNAIISAQAAADEIIRKAKAAEDDIIRNARNQAVELKSKSSSHVQSILNAVKHQKELYRDFIEEYEILIKKYVRNVDEQDFAPVIHKFDNLERFLLSFSAEPDESAE
jgi:cell division septum initiation protein DivIVA